jgi:hypothetical protein
MSGDGIPHRTVHVVVENWFNGPIVGESRRPLHRFHRALASYGADESAPRQVPLRCSLFSHPRRERCTGKSIIHANQCRKRPLRPSVEQQKGLASKGMCSFHAPQEGLRLAPLSTRFCTPNYFSQGKFSRCRLVPNGLVLHHPRLKRPQAQIAGSASMIEVVCHRYKGIGPFVFLPLSFTLNRDPQGERFPV